MAAQQLQRTLWQPYFDRLSRELSAQFAEIEVTGLQLSEQNQEEWAALNDLFYDPTDDVLEVITATVDHLIYHPLNIYIDRDGAALLSIGIIDASGTHRIIRLKQPISLSAL